MDIFQLGFSIIFWDPFQKSYSSPLRSLKKSFKLFWITFEWPSWFSSKNYKGNFPNFFMKTSSHLMGTTKGTLIFTKSLLNFILLQFSLFKRQLLHCLNFQVENLKWLIGLALKKDVMQKSLHVKCFKAILNKGPRTKSPWTNLKQIEP